MFRLNTLGQLCLVDPRGEVVASRTKPLLLLAVLACRPDYRAPVSYLQELLWPGSDPGKAAGSLRQALHQIRSFGDLIHRRDANLVLNREVVDVDLWMFEEAIEHGDFGRAIELYNGRFLGSFESGIDDELGRLVESRNVGLDVDLTEAFQGLINAYIADHNPSSAIEFAKRWVGHSPLSDAATLALMRCLLAAGDVTGVRRVYGEHRVLLDRELGDTPGDELEAVMEDLPARATPAVHVNPPDRPVPRAHRKRAKPQWPIPAIGMLIIGIIAIPIARSGSGDTSPAPSRLSIPVVLSQDGESWRALLHLTPEGRTFEPIELMQGEVTETRGGRLLAYNVAREHGFDMEVRDSTRSSRTVASDRADERPVRWSPDERFLLFHRGWLDLRSLEYRTELAIWDRVRDSTWVLADIELTRFGFDVADWSPEGRRLAVLGRNEADSTELIVVDLDGSVLQRHGVPAGRHGKPRWSPDGSRIAFQTAVSDSDIQVLTLSNSEVVDVARGTSNDRSPLWLSHSHLAYRSAVGDSVYLVVTDLRPDGETYILSVPFPLQLRGDPIRPRLPDETVTAVLRRSADRVISGLESTFIHELQVRVASSSIGVREWSRVFAVAVDSAGHPVPFRTRVDWRTSNPKMASISRSGWVRGVGPGETILTAELPGGVSSSARLFVTDYVGTDSEPSFTDDWSAGLRRTVWVPFGDPFPSVHEMSPGASRYYLVPNGDQNYDSGVASVRRFSLSHGLALEVTVSGRMESKHFQGFGIELTDEPLPDAGHPAWSRKKSTTAQIIGSLKSAVLSYPDRSIYVPWPDMSGIPGTYTLQVDPDGEILFFVNGRAHARLAVEKGTLPDSARVVLGGTMIGTELRFESVRVYEGVRYVARGDRQR